MGIVELLAALLKEVAMAELEKVVVTEWDGLYEYMVREDIIEPGVPRYAGKVSRDEIAGKHVYGILPVYLAAAAALVTEVPVRAPPGMYNQELSVAEIGKYARPMRHYRVVEIPESEVN